MFKIHRKLYDFKRLAGHMFLTNMHFAHGPPSRPFPSSSSSSSSSSSTGRRDNVSSSSSRSDNIST